MYLYHGSNKKFSAFNLDKCSTKDSLKEGRGIYLADAKNIKVPEAYGKYLYKVQVPNEEVLDLTKLTDIKMFLNYVRKCAPIVSTQKIQDIANMIKLGEVSIFDEAPEIIKYMENSEELWIKFPKDADKMVEKALKQYNRILSLYAVVKYKDKELGVIYICKHNSSKLKIVKCTEH